MSWFYCGEEVTIDDLKDYLGFVYCITNKSDGKKYIGKKMIWSTRRLPPLKGKKRKRIKVMESDWMDYYGSSEEVREILEERGRDNFHREILHLCKTKGELSYKEAKEQFDNDVLLRDDYYNGIINVRINKNHVKNLWKDGD